MKRQLPKRKYVPLYKRYFLYSLEPKNGIPILIGNYARLEDVPRINGTYFHVAYVQGEIEPLECHDWSKHYGPSNFLKLKMAGICTVKDYMDKNIDEMCDILYNSRDEKNRKHVRAMRAFLRKRYKDALQ